MKKINKNTKATVKNLKSDYVILCKNLKVKSVTFKNKSQLIEAINELITKEIAMNKNDKNKKEKRVKGVYFFPDESTQAFLIDTELAKGERSAIKIAKATKLNPKRIYKRIAHIKQRKGCPYFVEKK